MSATMFSVNIVPKQGRPREIFTSPMIACEFGSWVDIGAINKSGSFMEGRFIYGRTHIERQARIGAPATLE